MPLTAPTSASAKGTARPWLEQTIGPLMHTALALVASGIFYVVNSANTANNTAAQLAAFRSEIVNRMGEYQSDTKARFDELVRQVAGLPDESASLHQLELRVTRLEAAKADRDKQIGDLTGTILQDHADLAAMRDANRPRLGQVR